MQITTNRFKLIPLKKHHATDRYLSWLHDPEVNETLDTVGRDETIETIEKYILSYKNGDILFGIFSKDGNLHIEDDIGQYLNHNCSPNTCVVNENDPKLVAINDISIGDELTFDYNSSEDEIHYVFKCNCHGKEIVGKLGSSLDSID